MKIYNIKYRFSILLVVILMINSIAGCKKYEDGPWVSLRSKKTRLLGKWKVVSIDGEEQANKGELIINFQETPFKPIAITFSSYDENAYESYAITGSWAWKSNKDIVEVRAEILKADWSILRLKKKEFWFIDEHKQTWKCEKQDL